MNIDIKFNILYVPHMSNTTICYVLCKSVHMLKKNFLNGFHIIYVVSIIIAQLKWISCFLTELRLLFMPFSDQ